LPKPPRRILLVIVASQFAGTSLWFASNAVLGDLQQQWGLAADALGYMTSAVLLGFIVGTLSFAFFAIADQFSSRVVFLTCSLLGAAANLGVYLLADGLWSLLFFRFVTGFFLAGIYPVGMKIAAGWYKKDLGKAIGFLIGALVLGTALPHLLKTLGHGLAWQTVTVTVSAIAAAGGLLMYALVPDGPYLVKGTRFDPKALASIFRSRLFRASAFGYFGHMWELYGFWTFAPVVLAAYVADKPGVYLDASFWAFCVIGIGSVGCAGGGLLSLKHGSGRVAFTQLMSSGLCCLLSPLVFHAPLSVYLAFLLFWGIVVVGDSPQFSTLNAENAPIHLVGSALTIANCIGFAISIFSLQLLNYLITFVDPSYLFLVLALGPLFGLVSMIPLIRVSSARA
jgi:Major Facilitator Superfamily